MRQHPREREVPIGRPNRRRRWVIGSGIVVLLVIAGAVAISNIQKGQAVADRIVASRSPLIQQVALTRANPFEGSPDEILVTMAPGTTKALAVTFWCEIVIPAGHDADRARVTLVSSDGSHQLAFKAVCPQSSPAP